MDDAESYGGMRKARLEKYEVQRDFSISPEPTGARGKDRELKPGQRARFVIQKHAAKRPHYDLRLEIGGALRSWALPKEPISDPKIKRLAIEVEDHPLRDLQFEGAIPHGQYGAGEVEIWDRGAFRLDGHGDAQSQLQRGKAGIHVVRRAAASVIRVGAKLARIKGAGGAFGRMAGGDASGEARVGM